MQFSLYFAVFCIAARGSIDAWDEGVTTSLTDRSSVCSTPFGDYNIGKTLSSSPESTVFVLESPSRANPGLILKQGDGLDHEYAIMQQLNGLRVSPIVHEMNERGMVMEKMPKVLSTMWPARSVDEVLVFGAQLIRLVFDLNVEGIVHGDIHAGNIGFNDEGEMVLLDFGQARDIDDLEYKIKPREELNPILLSPWHLVGSEPGFRDDLWRAVAVIADRITEGGYSDRLKVGMSTILRKTLDRGGLSGVEGLERLRKSNPNRFASINKELWRERADLKVHQPFIAPEDFGILRELSEEERHRLEDVFNREIKGKLLDVGHRGDKPHYEEIANALSSLISSSS